MKQLFRYTSTLLRTALLFGGLALVNTQQIQAQPVSITADMPDAFETKNPVIGDGEYYYVQFYMEDVYSPYLYQSFLGELGEGGNKTNQMQAMDYLPFAANRLWTLVAGSDATHFKLKSKRGFYVYYGGDNRFYTTENGDNASEFTVTDRGSYRAGFKELMIDESTRLGRWSGSEWGGIIKIGNYNEVNFVRFAKLKPTAAHIIYYRGEGADNTDPQALTTRHYLTYSGTGNPPAAGTANLRSSDISSRQSIIPNDKSLWTLPTAAVYHQDGLWKLEEGTVDGEFFIKKFGPTDEYLNPSGTLSVLGPKDLQFGKYSLETPTANRYTRVQNATKYDFSALTNNHFYQWNSTTAGAASIASANVAYNVGNDQTINSGGLVIGTGEVWYHTYADMTGCKKLVIEGDPGLYLRVYLNRQVPIAEGEDGYDAHGGSFVQKFCTLDEHGRAEVDVSDLSYVHINAIKNWGNTAGKVRSINVLRPKLETVPLDRNQFHYWNDLNGESINTEYPTDVYFHVNDGQTISPDNNLVAGTGSVFYRTYADLSGSKKMVIIGTAGMILRVILNRQEPIAEGEPGYDRNGGAFVERVATIGSNGYAEIDLSDLSYVHLVSIKVRGDSPSGTITAINLIRLATTGDTHFLNHADGDGWQVLQWTGGNANDWYAGFYPVEVPASMKDEFFQVRVRLNPTWGTLEERQYIPLNPKKHSLMTRNSILRQDGDNIIGAKYTSVDDENHTWQNCFQYTGDNALSVPTGSDGKKYEKIVIRFASPVTGAWGISGIVGGNQTWENIPEGSLYYEMDLTDINTINDFTIFSRGQVASIEIAEIYFYKGSMIRNTDGAGIKSSEGFPSLWELEQDGIYQYYRLKNPTTGKYLAGNGEMTNPNDPTNAETNPNTKFCTDFTLKWYIPTNQAPKEILVNGYVTHRISYLQQYADQYRDLPLSDQGLATEVDSDWKIYSDDLGGFKQKTNHFEITHYVKQGNSKVIDFPTVLNNSNDHVYFQRFYNYDEIDTGADGTGMDLANLKAHVSLDDLNDGNVQHFLYKNGLVTGQQLDWRTYDSDTQTYIDIPDGGMKRNVQRRFNFTNTDGQPFTVAVDVSRYSDMSYANANHLECDLQEPSLTMRYLYFMKDAKDMAARLTACPEDGSEWLETKVFHFPARRVGYELEKKVGYQGEFIGLRHLFSDYWVFDDDSYVNEYNTAMDAIERGENVDITYLNSHLISAVNDNTGGKIEVEIVDEDHGGTGIRLGGWNPTIAAAHNGNLKFHATTTDDWGAAEADFQGFYFYDKMSDGNKTEYGNSRFVVFRYPVGGVVSEPTYTEDNVEYSKKAYINVYLNAGAKRYKLAQYTIIFDPGTQTLPWKLRDDTTNPTEPSLENPLKFVQGSKRDPKNLVRRAGHPIAKISFDYPANSKYHFPDAGQSKQGWWTPTGGTIDDCSPIPLVFETVNSKTNYSFMGFEANWGSYSIVKKMTTNYGNHQNAAPANDSIYGYGPTAAEIAVYDQLKSLRPDKDLQDGFLYIDASEQPGDICSAPFVGDFCAGDLLMFSGWISGSNTMNGRDNRCPGGITLTVKGEHNMHNEDGTVILDEKGNPVKETVTLYRFCPGQCYELDDGPNDPDGKGNQPDANQANCDNGQYNVIWQQFYFEFKVTGKYDRHWIEVNNNCVSSQGGDFMLDNIEVYAVVPEVIAGVNTPLCVSLDENGKPVTDMRLLKLSVDFNKLKESANPNAGTKPEIGFVFLDKYKFLETFRAGLADCSQDERNAWGIGEYDFNNISLDVLADAIEAEEFVKITGNNQVYRDAFDAAIVGEKTTWYSKNSNTPGYNEAKKNASILYFEWDTNFENMPLYSFTKAVEKTSPVYREVVGGEKFVVMNGNFPKLDWKTETDYYIVNTNVPFETGSGLQFSTFNICSECSKVSTFRIDPPYRILGLDKSEETHDYMVCEGQIPTMVTNLIGYDLAGNPVELSELNFDWWLGDKSDPDNPVLATLEKYHQQHEVIDGVDVYLDKALSSMRWFYPELTTLDGLVAKHQENPNHDLTVPEIKYLQKLVDAGQLVLHQTSISVPAIKASDKDPYFYLVACPIHDGYFDKALNHEGRNDVAYFCDEPQGLRVKVGEKAPTLKSGFVPNENGFAQYDYPTDSDPVLSIRLAKKEQFETVKNTDDEPEGWALASSENVHRLWLPIRNAQTEGATGVIKKSKDDNIYLASSNDPTWDKMIAAEMKQNESLPIVGRIVTLTAINTKNGNLNAQNDANRLSVYFTKNFDVREGYNYTLSLPFEEENDANACDGTILINLKIVPDYEVWTGAADNTDWNNDENWRRADGNTTLSNNVNGDELYRADGAVDNEDSPLHEYTTNKENYYNTTRANNQNKASKDQVLRKGFAPLYCTHVLMKSDEWGNAPVLYDAIDTEGNKTTPNTALAKKPFPNLRDYDGWDGTTDESEGGKTKATATPILRYDMQARKYDIWSETYGSAPNKGASGDLLAEMYQINSCDEIAFQPGTELRNAHLLNYNTAWVEYQLTNNRWYLLGSPLQGTIAGEWYAPSGSSQQKTTYYDPVTFNTTKYDRYAPAIYQRSWDQAKAVLYEIGSEYDKDDDSTDDLGSNEEGSWESDAWDVPGGTGHGDVYLGRLGYKAMGGNKANVAIQGIWSNTYNDATVDYTKGGFSVMVMNTLKPGETGKADTSGGKSIIRLPKEDEAYLYWTFNQDESGTNTQIVNEEGIQGLKERALNRGRLKTDKLLPESTNKTENTVGRFEDATLSNDHKNRYGSTRQITRIPIKEDDLTAMLAGIQKHKETVSAGVSHLGFYLVENPFPCGLDMEKFFEENTGLQKKYWLLVNKDNAYSMKLVQWDTNATDNNWVSPEPVVTDEEPTTSDEPVDPVFKFSTAKGVVAPGQGFFVEAVTPDEGTEIKFTKAMQAQSRFGEKKNEEGTDYTIVVGTKQKMEEVTETVVDENGESTVVTYMAPVVDGDGNYVLEDITETVTIYKYKQKKEGGKYVGYELKARTRGETASDNNLAGLVITAQRGINQSSALVRMRDQASNDFLPTEDAETFINSDLKQVPTVYTLCGRLATTINTIHDFRSLPVGVTSASDASCTLTFQGVELLGDSIAFYDAVEQTLTPLVSGMQVAVSGQTKNRYYIVRSLIKQEAAEETHLQIFTEGLTAKVIASTAEPIVSVRCYDTGGRLIHKAAPQTSEYSFCLPASGIYVIEAQTAEDRKTKKVMTN